MIVDYQTAKAEHYQDSTSYHQAMRILHLGEYLNSATSDRSSLWFRPIYPDLLEFLQTFTEGTLTARLIIRWLWCRSDRDTARRLT
jgi:hypothetical protein